MEITHGETNSPSIHHPARCMTAIQSRWHAHHSARCMTTVQSRWNSPHLAMRMTTIQSRRNSRHHGSIAVLPTTPIIDLNDCYPMYLMVYEMFSLFFSLLNVQGIMIPWNSYEYDLVMIWTITIVSEFEWLSRWNKYYMLWRGGILENKVYDLFFKYI